MKNAKTFGRIVTTLGMITVLGSCGDNNTSPPQPPACTFHTGELPQDTLPANAVHGAAIPIEHIIVFMQENRSFDSYFGHLPEAGMPDVDGLPANANNPSKTGFQPAFHQTKYCTEDTNHSWSGSHQEWDNGANDGFVFANDPDGGRAMGYYDQSDLPFYYALAKTFAIGDRYFCSALVGTFPNRFYLMTGTSFGHIRNDMQNGGYPQKSIFDELDANNISWKVYYSDFPFSSLLKVNHKNLVNISGFYTDAAAGNLPQVTFVDPAIGLVATETDEHPPANIQQGASFGAGVIEAAMQSPNWPTTALFFTYDEHGGFYDHVAPPAACVPDDHPPMLDPNDPDTSGPVAAFDRYGFRVPVVVVSPYAKPGHVSHVVYDHTSILRFIETKFDLPALTNRDANADPMLDMFDFSKAALLNPPTFPEQPIDPDKLDQCRMDFPGKVF